MKKAFGEYPAFITGWTYWQIGAIGGFVQAMDSLGARAGISGLGPMTGAMLAIGAVGGVGAWITATARLPYVAGVDTYLPASFGRLHPRYGTPYVAILTQATLSAVLIGVGQAGSSVKAAYELLVAMSLLFTFIPLMLMFSSAFRLAADRTSPGVQFVSPGMLRLMAASGFVLIGAGTLLFLRSGGKLKTLVIAARMPMHTRAHASSRMLSRVLE